ncbi:MAG TPA: chemoreceptor glutamine deamidase CheD [Spirochaetota bacterium]|nr:chemoreceptor glutamine deamidase CheD [Spirochaetota bacterium]HOM37549.1 chemoreceptor glutamine deamidase CheD [Spirochaetota bacterium]HPQ49479.1 chemoreceptor glutamine deamidase CheD [Spirochaetota bacterium]
MTLIKNDGINQHILLLSIGDYFATSHQTILSVNICEAVSVCLFDIENSIGGMNNFLLPEVDLNNGTIYTKETRIGVYVMDMLINEMLKNGAKRKNIKAKVFGGALNGISNIYFAKKYLEIEEIEIISSDLGGNNARKIFFYPVGGKVLLKKINDTNKINEINNKERKEFKNFENIFMNKKRFVDFDEF